MGNFYAGFGGLGLFVLVCALASHNFWEVLLGGLAITWCLPILMFTCLGLGKLETWWKDGDRMNSRLWAVGFFHWFYRTVIHGTPITLQQRIHRIHFWLFRSPIIEYAEWEDQKREWMWYNAADEEYEEPTSEESDNQYYQLMKKASNRPFKPFLGYRFIEIYNPQDICDPLIQAIINHGEGRMVVEDIEQMHRTLKSMYGSMALEALKQMTEAKKVYESRRHYYPPRLRWLLDNA